MNRKTTVKHVMWARRARACAAGLALAAGTAGAAAAEVTVFEHARFEGRRLEADGPVADFGRLGFNDSASSLVIRRGVWQLCTDAHYRGRCETFGPGRYASLSGWRFNDRVSSLRPVETDPRGPEPAGELLLFRHDDFAGRRVALAGPEANFGHFGLNDEVSSVVVRAGRWLLCSDAGFRGECITLGAGSYPSLSAYGLNDRLSSARPASPHEHDGGPPFGAREVDDGAGHAARSACARALGDSLGREQPGVERIELFDAEVELSRLSADEIGVRGAGQYETRRALTPFRFRCRWSLHSGEVTSLRYRD